MRTQLTGLLRQRWLIHTTAVLAFLWTVFYLLWRAQASLNPAALWLALPLLGVEVQGAVNFLLFAFMSWDPAPVAPRPAPPGLGVDILIPTYNEDLALLKLTILGALGVRYPHETWVLDDGRRPAVRRLCDELGAHYLTRPDNSHGKAGNLNAALARTTGDFLAIFDADQVPLPDYLDKTLGYFADPQLAFVQTPQEYYNLDSLQHRTDWQHGQTWHEQSLFYRVIQPGKNRWNAAFWCGSNSVIRRSALAEIGGVATESVTEDIQTSLRLHAAGWRSLQLDEVLAMGLAPHDFLAFTVQRLRWAQGAMQVLRRENPLLTRGLTLAQRVNYLASMTTYFEAFQRLVYLLAPLVVLATAILPIRVGLPDFLAYFVPYFVLGAAANVLLGRGLYRPLETERYNMLKMATFLKAATTLVGCAPTGFKVTPKAASEDTRAIRQLLRPYDVLCVLTGAAMALGALRLLGVLGGASGHADALLVAEGWALYNLWVLVHGIRSAAQHTTRRASYRFAAHVPVTVRVDGRNLVGVTIDLHQGGLSLLLSEALAPGASVPLLVHLPQETAVGTLHVRSNRPAGSDRTGALRCSGGPFTPSSTGDTNAINAFLIDLMPGQLQAAPTPQAVEPVAIPTEIAA